MLPVRSAALVLLTAFAAPVSADFTNPATPPWRGGPDTEFGRWENFSSAFGGSNLPDVPGSTSLDADLVQLDPSAFLVAGNIYSFAAPLVCRLSDTVPTPARTVWLQVSTRGNELDYAGVALHYVDSAGVARSLPWTRTTELARTHGSGVDVETLFEWDLLGVADFVGRALSAFGSKDLTKDLAPRGRQSGIQRLVVRRIVFADIRVVSRSSAGHAHVQ